MFFDLLISNPPYNLGGKIINNSKDFSKDSVVLMTVSNYNNKGNELWRYVKSMNVEDPKIFDDANISRKLCICVLQEKTCDVFKCYEDMEMLAFDKKYIEFYSKNSSQPKRYYITGMINASTDNFIFDVDFIESIRLPCNGYGFGNNIGYSINVLKKYSTPLPSGICVIHFETPKAKDNFSKWVYLDKGKNNLANNLIFGLSLLSASDRCSLALPQIDWESISEHPLWNEGRFDDSVLDVMGLKLVGDRIIRS